MKSMFVSFPRNWMLEWSLIIDRSVSSHVLKDYCSGLIELIETGSSPTIALNRLAFVVNREILDASLMVNELVDDWFMRPRKV